jgi:hypothetical protein
MLDEAVHEDDGTLDFCRSLKTSIELHGLRNCDPFVCVRGGARHCDLVGTKLRGRVFILAVSMSSSGQKGAERYTELSGVHRQSMVGKFRDAASFPPWTR